MVQGLMKGTDGKLVEQFCEEENGVCLLVWLGLH